MVDTEAHFLWGCPGPSCENGLGVYQQIRNAYLTPEQIHQLSNARGFVSKCLLFPLPPEAVNFEQQLTDWNPAAESLTCIPPHNCMVVMQGHEAMVATDGTCVFPQQPCISRAGWGFHCSVGGVWDQWGPLPGVYQTNNRAEAYAIWRALCTLAAYDVFLVCDSKVSVDKVDYLLDMRPPRRIPADWDNEDIWRAMVFVLDTRQRFGVKLRTKHVNSHGKGDRAVQEGRMTGQEQKMNIEADRLADLGAASHAPSDQLVHSVMSHAKLIQNAQMCAVEIMLARARLLPGESDEQGDEHQRDGRRWRANAPTSQANSGHSGQGQSEVVVVGRANVACVGAAQGGAGQGCGPALWARLLPSYCWRVDPSAIGAPLMGPIGLKDLAARLRGSGGGGVALWAAVVLYLLEVRWVAAPAGKKDTQHAVSWPEVYVDFIS